MTTAYVTNDDLFNAASVRNARAIDDQLRETAPVVKLAREGITMLARYKDVSEGLRDWKTFSSETGTLIDTDASLLPETMFHMDPPRHDQLRSILSRVLTPSRIANLEPVVRQQAQALVDTFKAGGMTIIQPNSEDFSKPVLATVPKLFEDKWGKGTFEALLAL